MGIRVPRITLSADYGDESSFGDLGVLSVGYGLHQAWVYATMFGSSFIFGTQTFASGMYDSHVSLAYLVSIVVFGFCLLLAATFDQRFMRLLYTSKQVLIGASLLACIGSLLLIPDSSAPHVLEVASGILTGVGSATLILFWGVAFAHCDATSIMLNASFAIPIGMIVYAVFLHYLPFPLAGLLASIIPLLEMLIIRKKTPQSFVKHSEIPAFNPLPINRAKFVFRFGVPVAVFGIALGMLRQTSIQYIVSASSSGSRVVLLLAAGASTVVILIAILAVVGSKWTRFFRPLVPFIVATLFFLPLSSVSDVSFSNIFILIGYLCFEALMWMFFGELSQNFRLSPILVFGLGRGLLAIFSLFGSLMPIAGAEWFSITAFGEHGLIVAMMLIMIVAYALLPHEHEIETIVTRSPLSSLGTADTVACEKAAQFPGACPLVDSASQSDGCVSAAAAASAAATATAGMERMSDDSHAGAKRGGGRFRARVEIVANTYLLSQREAEILFLLAKGYNRINIQEKLYISEGTAKTHIRHIYEKTNIHSQQKLIRLIESTTLTE
jgi:DNA-binding CsgD family transcriptional regulator